jgi:hypothetical protein
MNKNNFKNIIEIIYYRMSYLDLLPNDITKIINRKVQDLHIIERRKERKENRKINREQKQKANRKRNIYEKYVYLYKQYVLNQKWDYCCDLVAMMKKEFGKDHLSSQMFIQDDKSYIISTIQYNGSNYNIKVL